MFYISGYNSYLPNFQAEYEKWDVNSQFLKVLPQKNY